MTYLQRWTVLLSGLFLSMSAVNAEELKPLPGQESVRVCADGYNMPYSNKEKEGFDNKIAALLGEELGIPDDRPRRLPTTRQELSYRQRWWVALAG